MSRSNDRKTWAQRLDEEKRRSLKNQARIKTLEKLAKLEQENGWKECLCDEAAGQCTFHACSRIN